MADASYPDDLKYHAEHDWARIDGDSATFGITWYAQDQLGEVVFFDPPEVGTTLDQGPAVRRGRVGQGRLGRRRAALRRDRRGQRGASSDTPETINEDPYGAGWLVKMGSRTLSEVDDLMDASSYEGQPGLEPLHLRHRRRPRGDARAHRRAARSTTCSPTSRRACGSAARSTCRRASRSRRCTRTCASWRPATSPPRTS